MPKIDPLVSVVIVNYNSGKLLQQAIEAVQLSTINIEIFVVDNASSDGSLQRLDIAENITLIQNTCNLGFAAANNQALEQVHGEYVLLLNPDCLVNADTLAEMVQIMQQHPDAGMAGCRILNSDGSEQRGCRRTLPDAGSGIARAFGIQRAKAANINLDQDVLPDQPIFVEAISGAFMLVRRSVLAAVGLLDEAYFLHCEDLDWCRRFIDAGWKILFVPTVEVIHYQGACSARTPVRVSWHKHRGMALYYQKFLQQERHVLFNWLVYAGIYARFFVLAMASVPTKLFRRVPR